MNTNLVNTAAGVIGAAMRKGKQTPAGIAVDLDSACLLQSPETAAELHDLRTRLAGMANPPREVFLAEYDGVEPELHSTVEAARAFCDDVAPVDAHGKCWDWTVNEHGIHIQYWTHPDDDRPMGDTSGTVTPIVVQGVEPVSELERLRARVAELEAAANCQSVARRSGARCCLPIRHRGDHRTEDKRQYWDDDYAATPADASVDRQVHRLQSLLAGQRTALEDPHDGPLAHKYLIPRDLPEMGGAR